jgi:hypothetical protein
MLGDLPNLITAEQVYNKTYTEQQVQALRELFDAHSMDLLPPLIIPNEKCLTV